MKKEKEKEKKAGVLYVVATPIGNMDDITMRALSVLKEADLVAAEDTRRTGKLLTHFGISTPLTSCFEHNELRKAPKLIEKIKAGKTIALTTDAGTPAISDPGYAFVRCAVNEGVRVVPIPGASALTAVLSVSGLPTDEFTFKGFLPQARGKRKKSLLALRGSVGTYVFYESPRRVYRMLEDVLEILGDIEVCVGRELTKLHEEILRGSVCAIMYKLNSREGVLKGEVVVVLRTHACEVGVVDVAGELTSLLDLGFSLNDAVKAVAKAAGLKKSEVYKKGLRLKQVLREEKGHKS